MSTNESVSDMYTDLVEEFRDHGHEVTIMVTDSKIRHTRIGIERGMRTLRIKAMPFVGVKNLIKKGIGMALFPYQYKMAYKHYLNEEQFDWIFMPTPPITLVDFVFYVKYKTNARFYLILRDIHPQSSASLGEIKYQFMIDYLELRAIRGYVIADLIGCMSQSNIDFIANLYPWLDKSKLVLLLNWQKHVDYSESQLDIREKYHLKDKFVAIFGGNIGLGQRIENIYSLAKHYQANPNIVFLIVGKGVKKDELMFMIEKEKLQNVLFIDFLPRAEYLDFLKSMDLGLISINENNAVPTCPSKAVSYMALKIPILAMINSNSDYGIMIENAGAGYWSVGSNKEKVYALFDEIYDNKDLRKEMGNKGYEFYLKYLNSNHAYSKMMDQISKC